MEPLATPDVTPMQKLVGAVGGLLVSVMGVVKVFGIYDITGEQSAAVLLFWTSLGGVLVIADAVIRNGRARAFLNQPKGVVAADPPPPEPGA